jgi:aryl-alcohol dehydrogenase-like predicted oxidoreductase
MGSGGPSVNAVGLGGMALSSIYHPTDDESASALLRRAVELGVDHFDTSDAYGNGHNERLFGEALGQDRSNVFLATKFGNIRHPDGSRSVDGRPEYVAAACDASLTRLGVDVIDLYYIHRVDPNTPIEETMGALSELVSAGKVRHLGISEAAPATIRRAHAVHPLAATQVEFSLWTRFGEDELIPLCEELGIAYVAYSPLGRGFLTGTVKSVGDLSESDRRHGHPRFAAENIEANLELIRVVQDVAVAHGSSPSQVALAWVLERSGVMHVIPSTSSIAHLEENVAAGSLDLPAEDLDRLTAAFDPANVAGDRYNAGGLAKVQI